jgi:hypothetical protein
MSWLWYRHALSIPHSVSQSERVRERKRKRERKIEREKVGEREKRVRERGGREKDGERDVEYGSFIFNFKRKEGCLGTF